MEFILWIVAVILFIAGCFRLAVKQWAVGALLIIAAFLVGPGGVSIFSTLSIP